MTAPWVAAASAVFVWCFATGAILLVVRWADRAGGAAHGMAVLAGTPLLAGGIAALILAPQGTAGGVYAGFFGALAIWGWIELAFLTGTVTGPETGSWLPGLAGWPRFWRAWGTVSHHEAALLLGLLAVTVASAGATHPIALATYLILFGARISAKLNLFLGVPRINLEFVPARLAHLNGYFRRGPITPLFPVSITLLTFAVGCLAERHLAASAPAEAIAFALLTTLALLALLEHWLMVIPLPDAKLWRRMLPAPKTHHEGQADGL